MNIEIMLLHLFYAPPYNINTQIIKSFMCMEGFASLPQWFILYGALDKKQKAVYDEMHLNGHVELVYLNNFASLLRFAEKHKNDIFLLHGNLPYKVMFFLSVYSQRTDWICWGAKASINYNNIKSILLTPLKIFMYRRFYKIITLMDPDTDSLTHDFHVKNVEQISYYNPSLEEEPDFFSQFVPVDKSQVYKRKKILLGNSAHNIPYYLDILAHLSKFREALDVHCMMQYPKLDENIIKKFSSQAKSISDGSVTMDKEMMERYQYYKYLSNFDVYVCSNLNQSGLGAANNCLKLGLKVFLAGKNYEWLASLGYKVFDVSSIKNADDIDLFNDLSESEKEYNLNLAFKIMRAEKNKWMNYRKTLI